jgi:putative membrane protein
MTDMTDMDAGMADVPGNGEHPAEPIPDTPATDDASASEWRRLHPAGLIVALAGSVRAFISIAVSLLIAFRFIMDHQWQAWTIWAIIAVSAAGALIPPICTWASTRYQLGADSLTFKSGLFFRKHRTISYAKIHAINSASPVYLQPFGVVQLTVSAAGTNTDITLNAVPAALQLELEQCREQSAEASVSATPSAYTTTAPSRIPSATHTQATTPAATSPDAAAATIANAISAATPCATPPVPYESGIGHPNNPNDPNNPNGQAPVFRASIRDILLFAITDIGFLAAAFIVYGFVQRLQEFLPKTLIHDAQRSVNDFAARGLVSIVLLALVCVIVLMIISIAASLLRFYGFEVWRRGDDLVVVRGLFTRRTTTIPVSRIQTITIRRSLLRRPFHLCSVGLGLSASTTSDGGESDIATSSILPVIGTRRVYHVLRTMLPEWNPHMPTVHHTGRGLMRYYVTMPLAMGVIATAATGIASAITDMPWWLVFIPIALFAWWTACRCMQSHTEGYELAHPTVAGGPEPSPTRKSLSADNKSLSADDVAHNSELAGTALPSTTLPDTAPAHDCALPDTISHDPELAHITLPGTTSHNTALPSTALSNTTLPNTTLPSRITITGATGLTHFTLITRLSRVQSVKRSTTLWREPRGIERLVMPLFVTNGIAALKFLFLRRHDAEALAAWAQNAASGQRESGQRASDAGTR